MPTLMPSDTAAALGENARNCDSRSLLLDRFCDPTAREDARKQVFTRAMEKSALKVKSTAWITWLAQVKPSHILHTQLQSRLMVNMAGGVMENAGLCLDRFGLPYIPGSAVKGCARRAALAALHEWCTAGGQPAHQPTGTDNPLAACCAPFANPADMLAAIARTFGWCEQDWSDRSDQSDFRWACANNAATLKTAAESLADHFHWPIEDRHRDTPWKSVPNYAGSVSFLPAYPVDLGKTGKVDGLPLDVPPLGKLELDVVTVHHKQYYAEPAEPKDVPHSHDKWQRWKREHDAWEHEWGTAPDIEEPVPNVFPAVAPGHIFTFALGPLRGGKDPSYTSDPSPNPKGSTPFCPTSHARTWLQTGLQVFGLGAKTNAGYGWFVASEAVQATVRNTIEENARREREAREHEQAEQQRRQQEADRLRQKQEREAALANLSGDERADKEIELLSDQQFDAKVRAFCKEPRKGGPTEEQKKAIVRALRGPRLAYWQDFKTKSTKGELATVEQAIRQLSKQMNLGKMP